MENSQKTQQIPNRPNQQKKTNNNHMHTKKIKYTYKIEIFRSLSVGLFIRSRAFISPVLRTNHLYKLSSALVSFGTFITHRAQNETIS